MMQGVFVVFYKSQTLEPYSLFKNSKMGKDRQFLGFFKKENNDTQFLRENDVRQVLKVTASICTHVLVKQVSICTSYEEKKGN